MLGRLVGIIGFKDDRCLAAAGGEVTVDAVCGDIEGSVLEPFDVDIAGLKGDVFHFGEGFDPVQTLAVLGPEGVWVVYGCGIHLVVFGGVNVGVGGHGSGRGVSFGHSGFPFVFVLGLLVARLLPNGLTGGPGRGLRWRDTRRAARRFRALLRQIRQRRSRLCQESQRDQRALGHVRRFVRRGSL